LLSLHVIRLVAVLEANVLILIHGQVEETFLF
jgi:hypothetical protein